MVSLVRALRQRITRFAKGIFTNEYKKTIGPALRGQKIRNGDCNEATLHSSSGRCGLFGKEDVFEGCG